MKILRIDDDAKKSIKEKYAAKNVMHKGGYERARK